MADPTKHLLLVEDEVHLREAIAEQLTDHGYQVKQADSGEAALTYLSDFAFDVLVTDLRLPGIDGSAVVDAARERYPDIVAIVVTGYGTVKDAVEAIKRGASDFVAKPFQIDELLHAIDAALDKRRLKSENAYLRAQLEERYRFDAIVGKSRPMARLFKTLETVAATSSTILVTGETGTGKEVVARAVHHNSTRRAHQFVALNCSAIPETLLEAELFGHVRGAFTGAVGNRVGRMEQAHRGTLFLDEVAEIPLPLQAKLLRFLESREYRALGATQTRTFTGRVVAATHRNLAEEVRQGRFREDLMFRLDVMTVQVPSLRERLADLPALAENLLAQLAAKYERTCPLLRPEDLATLRGYSFPGNIRELRNILERSLLKCPEESRWLTLDLAWLRGATAAGSPPPPTSAAPLPSATTMAVPPVSTESLPTPPRELSAIELQEYQLIQKTLREERGAIRRAAARLGLTHQALLRRLQKWPELRQLDAPPSP